MGLEVLSYTTGSYAPRATWKDKVSARRLSTNEVNTALAYRDFDVENHNGSAQCYFRGLLQLLRMLGASSCSMGALRKKVVCMRKAYRPVI